MVILPFIKRKDEGDRGAGSPTGRSSAAGGTGIAAAEQERNQSQPRAIRLKMLGGACKAVFQEGLDPFGGPSAACLSAETGARRPLNTPSRRPPVRFRPQRAARYGAGQSGSRPPCRPRDPPLAGSRARGRPGAYANPARPRDGNRTCCSPRSQRRQAPPRRKGAARPRGHESLCGSRNSYLWTISPTMKDCQQRNAG